jgi:hypothetical protein
MTRRAWRWVVILLATAWVPPFVPDAIDYIFRIPPSDGAGMAFVFAYITFLSYPLTAITLLIVLYKLTRSAANRIRQRPSST